MKIKLYIYRESDSSILTSVIIKEYTPTEVERVFNLISESSKQELYYRISDYYKDKIISPKEYYNQTRSVELKENPYAFAQEYNDFYFKEMVRIIKSEI
jgi:hypothetical protein